MSSKNNPELRGAVTELRKHGGKPVKPARIVSQEMKINFIGAVYENGDIVVDNNKRPLPYSKI